MELNAKETTFERLMKSCGSSRFYIDFYQREYKWNDKLLAHKPVGSLLRDIWLKFFQAYEPGSIENCEKDVEKYPWYYLSSVLTNTCDGKIYIVDGQQRLTTLTVAIIALLANENINENIEKYLSDLIVSKATMAGNNQIRMEFDDRAPVFKALMQKPDDEDIQTLREEYSDDISASNIIAAYCTCKKFFDDNIRDELLLAYFGAYLSTRLYLVKIDMEKSEDVAMAFEVINDRGTKLQSYEILKGKLLSLIPKDNNEKEIKSWNDSAGSLMTLYQKDRSDEFFESFFQARYAEDAEKDRKNLAKYNYHQNIFADPYDKRIGLEWTPDGKKRLKTAKELLNSQIPYYSGVFRNLYEIKRKFKMDKESDERFVWFNGRNGLMANQTQLIMSSLTVNDPLEAEKITVVSKKLDKLYTLLKLTGTYESSGFSPICKKLSILIRKNQKKTLQELNNQCDQFILREIQKAKTDQGIQKKESPFDYISWNQLSFGPHDLAFVRYFFARIEGFIAVEADQVCDGYDKLLTGDSYHVEHILAHDKNGDNASKFADEEEFEFQRSLYGAIGLLKGPVNCSSNAEPYPDKRRTYACETLWLQTLTDDFYKSNPSFAKFSKKRGLDFKPCESFGATEIKERAALLAKMTKLIWE